MTATLAFIVILVFLALVFDYINGFHDAANSIATVVSTRVLSPGLAVIWAAFFNFIAFAVFGTRVAKAIGDGVRMDLISPELRLYVLLAALLGAIVEPDHVVSRAAHVELTRIARRVCGCGYRCVWWCERIAQS
jgi:PiT family inorganic phosphate transporter